MAVIWLVTAPRLGEAKPGDCQRSIRPLETPRCLGSAPAAQHDSGSSFDRQSICVFCLALTPSLAIAHIQNTAHRQTANRSGPLLPGLCCAPVVCLSPSSLRYRHTNKELIIFETPHKYFAQLQDPNAKPRSLQEVLFPSAAAAPGAGHSPEKHF